MIESVGGSARIVTAQNSTSGHAYPELYIGNSSAKFEEAAAYIRQRYHVTDVGCHITLGEDGPRYWLNLDWWSRHPGGRFFADDGERIAYYPDGRWEVVETAADHRSEQANKEVERQDKWRVPGFSFHPARWLAHRTEKTGRGNIGPDIQTGKICILDLAGCQQDKKSRVDC